MNKNLFNLKLFFSQKQFLLLILHDVKNKTKLVYRRNVFRTESHVGDVGFNGLSSPLQQSFGQVIRLFIQILQG